MAIPEFDSSLYRLYVTSGDFTADQYKTFCGKVIAYLKGHNENLRVKLDGGFRLLKSLKGNEQAFDLVAKKVSGKVLTPREKKEFQRLFAGAAGKVKTEDFLKTLQMQHPVVFDEVMSLIRSSPEIALRFGLNLEYIPPLCQQNLIDRMEFQERIPLEGYIVANAEENRNSSEFFEELQKKYPSLDPAIKETHTYETIDIEEQKSIEDTLI